MSGTNGDKSRFHRQRKHNVEQRLRNRELQNNLAKQVKAPPASSAAKPKVTVA